MNTSKDYDKFLHALSERIKKLRDNSGLTQEVLAAKCRISRSRIAGIESCSSAPSLLTIFQIAKGLKIEPSELLDIDY